MFNRFVVAQIYKISEGVHVMKGNCNFMFGYNFDEPVFKYILTAVRGYKKLYKINRQF